MENKKDENSYNIVYFYILSSIIEIIILTGVYYNRLFEHRIMKEYEDEIINTPNFRKWKTCMDILDLIFNYGEIDIDSTLPSTNALLDIIEINNIKIKKSDLVNTFKIFSYLKIYESKGNKRYLKMTEEDAKITIKEYFKIY